MLARINLEDLAHDEGRACSPVEGVAREESDLSCQVCTEPLNDSIHRPAAGACEHFDVCALCYLRLRLILKDNTCPMCKTPLEHVYVFESHKAMRPFSSLSIWGTEAGPGYSYDDRAQMFMPKTFHEDVYKVLQAFICRAPGCGAQCPSMGAFREHLRAAHDFFLCDVCLEHKQCFLGEQTLYSRYDLAKHRDKGNPSQGFFGHPACNFCNRNFYDTGHLYQHFVKAHYSCDICERQLNIQHKYYRDYADLERHFRREHYLCEDPRCLEQRFVVFANEIDFRGHLLASHPEMAGGQVRKLNVAFKIKGSRTQDEEAKGGGEGREAGAPSSFQMTTDAFPDLSQQTARASGRFGLAGGGGGGGGSAGSGGGTVAALVGGGRRAAALSREDFPALPGGGGGGGLGGLAAFRNALMPQSTRVYNDRDRWSYPEVNIVTGNGKGKGKKKKGGGGGGGAAGASVVDLAFGGGGGRGNNSSSSSSSSAAPAATAAQSAALAAPRPVGGEGLMEEIQSLIGEEAFTELRHISRELRTGARDGEGYYDEVKRLIPHRQVRLRVMADLLDILPDEALKAEIQALIDARDPAPAQSAPSAGMGDPTPGEAAKKPAAPKPKTAGGGAARKPAAPLPNSWGKALASASGGGGGPRVVGKGQRKPGLTLVRFKSSGSDDGGGERPVSPPSNLFQPPPGVGAATASSSSSSSSLAARLGGGGGGGGGGGLGQDAFPSLAPAPARAAAPPPVVAVGKAARDAMEDDEGFGGGAKGKKGKQKKNKVNFLELAAFKAPPPPVADDG